MFMCLILFVCGFLTYTSVNSQYSHLCNIYLLGTFVSDAKNALEKLFSR